MNNLSVTIVTKNEEKNIERCLKSLTWVDEIVVLDTGSTDSTREICQKYNCKIVNSDWKGFGRTKKRAVDSAKNNWILSVDSDEEVTKELQSKIIMILNSPKNNAYRIKRSSFYLDRMIKHCGWNSDYPLRLFNKEFGNFNDREIHEFVEMTDENNIGKIEEPLLHYTYPTIDSHIAKANRYSTLQAEEMKQKGKSYSLITAKVLAINKFVNMYFLRLGFLDGKEGFILCSIASFGVYLKYIKLWKLNKN